MENKKDMDALWKEKASLESAISENISLVSSANNELAELNQNLNTHYRALEDFRTQLQTEKKRKSELSEEIATLNSNMKTAEENIASAQVELSKLSFLAFGAKKGLKAKIDAACQKVSEIKSALNEKENNVQLLCHPELQEKLLAEESTVSEIKPRISEKTQLIENLKQTIKDGMNRLNQVIFEMADIGTDSAVTDDAELQMRYTADTPADIVADTIADTDTGTAADATADNNAEAVEGITADTAADTEHKNAIERAIEKLEMYFPEHKVFAFDSIDSMLRDRLAELYRRAGYSTIDELLSAYGFEIISGDAVKELRSFVKYTPGNEPECIRSKVESMLDRLNEYYPDHIIPRGIQNDHKSLSQSVSGLYQWLGYKDAGEMLSAYGYKYCAEPAGRPVQDFQPALDALIEKYKHDTKPKSMGELFFDNPEYKATLKTLQNKSTELFGMTLTKYLAELGILASRYSGSVHTLRTGTTGLKDNVVEALTARYKKVDENECGTLEDALYSLQGMNVKRNKAGLVYIFRAEACDATVTIPYGIDFISDGAFCGQRNLRKVLISADFPKIPADAFSNCTALERIEIPEGITEIRENAFSNCVSLKSISLPKSLQQISTGAFANCTSLESVDFGNPFTLVWEGAFSGSSYTYEPPKESDATDSQYFEYSIDRKGNVTISGFTGTMGSVVIPTMLGGHPVTTIGKGAFQDCSRLVDVSMSDYITTMQGDSFQNCISLKRIRLSNGISKIISTSFNGCIGLEEINIPDAVTEIKRGTFKDAPISKLHIGKSLSSIESKPFYNGEYDPYSGEQKTSRAVNTITVDPENPYLVSSGSMVLSKDGKTLLAVLGNEASICIPDGVEVINNFALEGLVHLTDISLPDTIISVGERAFARTAIRSVQFGSNVRKIGAEAFSYCQKLTAAVFNEGLEEIGYGAFAASPIVSVFLPASLRFLGMNAFNCLQGGYGGWSEQVQGFRIHPDNPIMKADGDALYVVDEGVKILQALYGSKFHLNIYDGMSRLEEYIVQDGTTHIGPGAFCRCASLAKVTLPESLVSIGDNAFSDCQGLEIAALPSGIEYIGENAFKGSALREFDLGAAVREIGAGAFVTGNEWENQPNLLHDIRVDPNNSVFYIEKKTLMKKKPDGSSAVVAYFGEDETISLPEGVSEIYAGAFTRSIIQEIAIPSSVTVIGERAFSGCSNLVRLRVGFNDPENGVNYAVIYIPETRHTGYEYAEYQIRDQYMDCIRIDNSGSIFDFVKYDSLFETIDTVKDKVLVATDRLKSAIQLVPLYREQYLGFLRENAETAVEIVSEFDDLPGLNTLAELGVFTGQNIGEAIEAASRAQRADIIGYLLNYKNSSIEIQDDEFEL